MNLTTFPMVLAGGDKRTQRIDSRSPIALQPSGSVVLRRAAEDVLRDGENLAGFIEYAVRAQIQQRQEQAAFVARGWAPGERAKVTSVYFSSAAALKKLDTRLAKAKKAAP